MIRAVNRKYLEERLQDEVTYLYKNGIEIRLNETVRGVAHPEHKDHFLVYEGFEANRDKPSITIYARKTSLEEIVQSIKPEDTDLVLLDLNSNREEAGEGQALYDSILIEARIGCVRPKQHSMDFEKQLKEITDNYKNESWAKLKIKEMPCRNNDAKTYFLQGLFNQDVFSRGVGWLYIHLSYVFKPYISLKNILQEQSRSGKKDHEF